MFQVREIPDLDDLYIVKQSTISRYILRAVWHMYDAALAHMFGRMGSVSHSSWTI